MSVYSIIQKSQLDIAKRIDAEYFMPEFLDLATHLKDKNTRRLDSFGKITASAFYPAATQLYSDKGLPFIRVVDVVNFPIVNNSQPIERLPEEFIDKCQGIDSIKSGDIVISKVGTPCYASIISDSLPRVALTRTVLGVKNVHGINPYYLLAFLRSKYGFYQLVREMEQQIQLQLTLERVRKIKVFVPSEEAQKVIADKIIDYYKAQVQSISLYNQAEDLLLEELGLKDYWPEELLSCVVNFSELKEANRIDADYFLADKNSYLSNIKNVDFKKLGELVTMKKGFEPGSEAYKEEGKPFIRVSNISVNGLVDRDQKYLSDELYLKLENDFRPQVGEILLTKDASPGVAMVMRDEVEGIISGGILRLRVNDEIDSDYLALCINSVIGQEQVKKEAGGSIIAHWKPEQVKNFLVPILPKETQQKVADLVKRAHEARKKSKELLEEAKRKVEEMVEKGNAQ